MKPQSKIKTTAWTLGAILPWATMAAAIQIALQHTSSAQLLIWSFAFATPAAFMWDKLLNGRSLRDMLNASATVLLVGLPGIFGWSAGLLLSLDRAPTIEANLLTYLWPLMMVALAPLAGESFSLPSLTGVLIGFLGAGLLVTGDRAIHIEGRYFLGYGLALAAALGWTLFVILLERQGEKARRRTPVFVAEAFVASVVIAFTIDGTVTRPPWVVIAAAAWLGVAPLSLSFVCWDRAMAVGHLALAGRLSYLDPLISTLLLVAVLGRLPTARTWSGMALIIIGVGIPELRRLCTLRCTPGSTIRSSPGRK